MGHFGWIKTIFYQIIICSLDVVIRLISASASKKLPKINEIHVFNRRQMNHGSHR